MDWLFFLGLPRSQVLERPTLTPALDLCKSIVFQVLERPTLTPALRPVSPKSRWCNSPSTGETPQATPIKN
jgi:hypothetical protein